MEHDAMTAQLTIEMLLDDLSHLDRGVRERAVKGLAEIGESAIPPLVAYLNDQYNQSRNMAARALGLIGSPQAIPALSEALKDYDEIVRSVAAWALGQIGDKAAVPILLTATHDSKHCVRTRATSSLQQLGHDLPKPSGGDEILIRQRITELRSRPQFTRDQAYQALLQIGQPAVGALITALSEPEPWARKAAADALGAIGDVSASEALKLVQKNDPDLIVRQAASLALQQLAVLDASTGVK